ncbi:MAG: hypothetical protein AB7O66_25390 [Limisphaerales bacterium]
MRRTFLIPALMVAVSLLGLLLPRSDRTLHPSSDGADSAIPKASTDLMRSAMDSRSQPPPTRDHWRKSRPVNGADAADSNPTPSSEIRLPWVAALLGTNGPPPVSRETVDRWLSSGRTNASDLLALRQAGAGSEFLELALRQFPDDPRVLLAATSLNDSPEVVRERMDRFRAADPANALADYLSAWNELASGNREKALEHLTAANTKPGFQDYVGESARTAEELYRSEGRSEAEARALGSSTALLPHLAHLKRLSNDLADLQKELVAAGDPSGAAHVAHLGLGLSEQLTQGPGSLTLVGELVGIAVGANLVRNLPQDTAYEFLGGDAATYSANLKQRRADIRTVSGSFDAWIRQASEADVIGYFDVLAQYGERVALEWVRDQSQSEPKVP